MMARWLNVKITGYWSRLTLWVSDHRFLTRLYCIMVTLILFLVLMPRTMQIVFWNELISHGLLVSMMLVFSILAISLVWSTGQQVDAWAFLLFNVRGPRPVWLDKMMSGFTQIGSAFASMGVALVFFLAVDRLLAYEVILGTLTLWLVVELVKFVTHRSRPHIRLTQARIVGYRNAGRSFPSGHTSQVFFMAVLIGQHFHLSGWVVFLLFVTALLVGITRMYVGAHYPRDVLAGAILGSAWGLLGVNVDEFLFFL